MHRGPRAESPSFIWKSEIFWLDMKKGWRGLPEKADPRPGCSPERGAQSWSGGRLQVAPLTLLQAPLYVPLLGTRHWGALQHGLHVPDLWLLEYWVWLKEKRTFWYLDDMILPYSGEKLPSSIIAHVLHNVPGNKTVRASEGTLLCVCTWCRKSLPLESSHGPLSWYSSSHRLAPAWFLIRSKT